MLAEKHVKYIFEYIYSDSAFQDSLCLQDQLLG
jgi:hypothetical protein